MNLKIKSITFYFPNNIKETIVVGCTVPDRVNCATVKEIIVYKGVATLMLSDFTEIIYGNIPFIATK